VSFQFTPQQIGVASALMLANGAVMDSPTLAPGADRNNVDQVFAP
jgi:hypothetical protein